MPGDHAMDGRLQDANALSWSEIKQISAEMESVFRKEAPQDARRLRTLVEKRREITTTCQTRTNEAQRQLQHLLANVSEWEQHTAASRARQEHLTAKHQELEASKRNLVVQLERLREDEQTFKASLERIVDAYESLRRQVEQYDLEHRPEVDRAKHFMSLYAAVTGIKWDFSRPEVIAGEVHVPNTKLIVPFEIDDANTNDFDAANALWDKIDDAFDDVDNDL